MSPRGFVLSVMIALLDLGCGSTSAANLPPAPPMVSSQIAIAAQTITNRGSVLHMLLTVVDAKAPASSYDDEAKRFADSPPNPSIVGTGTIFQLRSSSASAPTGPNPSIVGTGMIFPGGSIKIPVRIPAEQALALAFFFTEPGANWRVVVSPPLPPVISVLLGSDGVDRLEPEGHGQ